MPSAPEICTLSLHDALPISMEEAPRLRTLSGIAGRGRALGVLRGPADRQWASRAPSRLGPGLQGPVLPLPDYARVCRSDRKSTRLNSSHLGISYAVFC